MYRRDYFLKLVQQFSKMVAKLMGLKAAGEIEKAKEVINEAYREFFNSEGSVLKSIPKASLITTLKSVHQMNEEQLELLAKLYYEEAEIDLDYREDLLNRSLLILKYLNEEQKMYSYEREELIQKILLLLRKG